MPDDEGQHSVLARRDLLRLIGGAAASLLAGSPRAAAALDLGVLFGDAPKPRHVTPEIIDNDAFYVVAVNPTFCPGFELATVDARWSLALHGLDGSVQSLGYTALQHRARRSVRHTFECIGNPVGGRLIGNARWQVVPLRELLQSLPGFAAAKAVCFESLDGFYSSVSIARATDDYAFVALGMNGVPLPPQHGFPARVLLPDLYGMKQPRWLSDIRLQADATTTSYWEPFGWAGEVPVQTMSRLDPPGRLRAGVAATLTGIAYAGRRGVRAVEVSCDGGAHWVSAELLDPPTPDVWSRWRCHWPSPATGTATLVVRAVDGNGVLQTASERGVQPSGATGWQRMAVEVGAG